MEQEELIRVLETLLFITDQPLTLERMAKITESPDVDTVKNAIAALQSRYLESGRAMQVLEVGGGYQMSTKPEFGRWIRKLFNEKMTARLSAASLENLSIIAYKQPITRAEIEAIRGVDAIASLETLTERGLIKVVGRKETVGRPLLYGTATDFLKVFGLNAIEDLPKLESFGVDPEMVAAAGKEEEPGPKQQDLFDASMGEEQPATTDAPPAQESVSEHQDVPEQHAAVETELVNELSEPENKTAVDSASEPQPEGVSAAEEQSAPDESSETATAEVSAEQISNESQSEPETENSGEETR